MFSFSPSHCPPRQLVLILLPYAQSILPKSRRLDAGVAYYLGLVRQTRHNPTLVQKKTLAIYPSYANAAKVVLAGLALPCPTRVATANVLVGIRALFVSFQSVLMFDRLRRTDYLISPRRGSEPARTPILCSPLMSRSEIVSNKQTDPPVSQEPCRFSIVEVEVEDASPSHNHKALTQR